MSDEAAAQDRPGAEGLAKPPGCLCWRRAENRNGRGWGPEEGLTTRGRLASSFAAAAPAAEKEGMQKRSPRGGRRGCTQATRGGFGFRLEQRKSIRWTREEEEQAADGCMAADVVCGACGHSFQASSICPWYKVP